jgi:predicted acetyltransferase
MFFEQLLPSLHLDDMWHAAIAATFPLGEWGTFGIGLNILNFGDIETWDPSGVAGKAESAGEFVIGLSYGMRLRRDFAAGITLKYFRSTLLKDEAEAQSFAVDAGLLRQNFLTRDLTLGFSLLNMGPAVQYAQDESKNPIPFIIRAGASYKPIRRATHHLLVAMDLQREFVYISENGTPAPFFRAIYNDLTRDEENWRDKLSKITLHTGLEFNYLDFLTPRLGWMYDRAGHRSEVNVGMGLSVNMIAADFGIIFTLGENTVRQNQMRFSITYAR